MCPKLASTSQMPELDSQKTTLSKVSKVVGFGYIRMHFKILKLQNFRYFIIFTYHVTGCGVMCEGRSINYRNWFSPSNM